MNNRLPPRTYPRTVRWLAVAGAVIGLSAPLAANADHRDNDAIEVLASAAIAYVVIDIILMSMSVQAAALRKMKWRPWPGP